MQDKIIKFLAYDGKISVVCANTTELVEKARQTHDLSPVTTAAFGRLLTMTAIMGNEMKSADNKLTIQLKGNGPIGTMLTTSNNFPKVKGYVANPVVDLPLNDIGKLDVGGAVGNEGFINVIKDIRTLCWNLSISIRRNSRRFCRILCKIRTKKYSCFIRSFSK